MNNELDLPMLIIQCTGGKSESRARVKKEMRMKMKIRNIKEENEKYFRPQSLCVIVLRKIYLTPPRK